MSATRPCRKCGMTIEFITGPNGKAIPAQKVRTVYRLRGPDGVTEEKLEKLEVQELFTTDIGLYVSHFETCPNASEFNRRSK